MRKPLIQSLPLGILPGIAALVCAVPAAAETDFYRDVYPFLKANCISCHNKTTTKAGLNMETPELMIKGGDSGPSIVPGNSSESYIVEASIHTDDMEMPPKNNKTGAVKLTQKEIGILKRWIDEGAKSSVQVEREVVWQPLAPGVHPIYTLAMTEDGRFAACGRSNEIHVYDLATRQRIGKIDENPKDDLGAHRALVHSLAFSPDGSRLASGSFREVKIWKREQPAPRSRATDPALAVKAATLSPDGNVIVASDAKGALLVINAADGKIRKKIDAAGIGDVPVLRVSPDGKSVAVLENGWRLGVWSLADGKLLHEQKSPVPALERDHQKNVAAHAAAKKAETAAVEQHQKAAAAKGAAEKELAAAKAKPAPAPKPVSADAPDQAPNAAAAKAAQDAKAKAVAKAEAKLAAAAMAEADAAKALEAARKKSADTKKPADDLAARVAAARQSPVRALAWTCDGKAIVTASDDKLLRAWALPAAGTAAFADPVEIAGLTAPATVLASGAAPDQVVSGGADGKVRIWSLAGKKATTEIATTAVNSVALSPDGKQLVTAGTDGAVRSWDVASKKQVLELRESLDDARKMAELDWRAKAESLEQAFQNSVVSRTEARTKAIDELLKKAEDAIVSMTKKLPEVEKAVKPTQEATAAEKKAVEEVEAKIAAARAEAPEAKPDAALEKELKTAQDKLITAQTKENDAVAAVVAVKSNITDAEAQKKRITETKARNTKEVETAKAAIEASKAAQAKATADLAAAKKALTGLPRKPVAVAFSREGDKVAASFDDGTLLAWAVATGAPVEQHAGTKIPGGSLVHRADGAFAVSGSDGSFAATPAGARWKLERTLGGEAATGLFADRVGALAFSPDGKLLAAGSGEASRSGDIVLFDAATGKVAKTWKERHSDSVFSLDFSPDGKFLASGAADKIARVTEVDTGKEAGLYEGHTHYVTGVSFRSDGRVLATSGADGVVNSWDLILGERKKKIEGWTKEVTSLQFIGATNQIVTSAGDNLIRIVNDDGAQIRAISKLPDFMQIAATSPNGATIVGGGEDSVLRVWNGADGKEIITFGIQ